MTEKDWIEQDEFERRKALFSGKSKAPAPAGAEAGAAAVNDNVKDLYAVPTVPADALITVIVQTLGGEVVFGPLDLKLSMCVKELLQRLPQTSESKRFARIRLVKGTTTLHVSESLTDHSDADSTSLTLTAVYDKPLPANAKIVGNLALWEPDEKGDPEVENLVGRDTMTGVVGRDANKKSGINCLTGDTFWYESIVGRCTSVTLRLGTEGLYYNSSSHGTATLTYNIYSHEQEDDNEQDGNGQEDECEQELDIETQLAIIPGPHCHGPKNPAAHERARCFVERLAEAAGQVMPRVDCASLAVGAWSKLCTQIDISDAYLSALYMPWIEKLGSMNEYEWFQWQQSGFPDAIADIRDEKARDLLEHDCTPEGAY